MSHCYKAFERGEHSLLNKHVVFCGSIVIWNSLGLLGSKSAWTIKVSVNYDIVSTYGWLVGKARWGDLSCWEKKNCEGLVLCKALGGRGGIEAVWWGNKLGGLLQG